MPRLTSKYAPVELDQFVGLKEPKAIIGKWLTNPYPVAFLFAGESGVGKTQLGLAIAKALKADGPFSFIHIASAQCNVEAVREIETRLKYAPWGGFWVVLIDEADLMTPQAQIAFLSILDAIPQNVVIIFTCNNTERFEDRFLSRLVPVKFSNYGLNGAGAAFLKTIWNAECPGAPDLDYYRVMKNNKNNIRAALMELESEMLSAGDSQ